MDFLSYRRKSLARNKREMRRPTQPVPADLLDRISKIDSIEEKQMEDMQPPKPVTQPVPEVAKKTTDSSNSLAVMDEKIPVVSPILPVHQQVSSECGL